MKDLASSYSITRDLWLNSKPVVWVFFLISSMTAIDRIFLSFHSPHSLEAAAYMGSFHIFLILPLVSIASIVEAFAARYDGSGEKQKISEAVWQMVFFGIFSILPIFLLIALIQSKGWKLFCGDEIAYLSTSLFFSPLWIILSTISAFFIGTKRGKLVQIAGLIANAVNLILDPILIFGVGSIVPELGCQGAALATGLAICVELALLSKVFFNTSNRNRYKTDWIIFNKAKFMEILRVGLPYGGLVMVQFGGWALYFFLIDLYAKNSLFLISILQSFMLFFSFFGMGLEKGATVCAGRLIGMKKENKVIDIVLSAFKLGSIFYLIFFALLELLQLYGQFIGFEGFFSKELKILCTFRYFVAFFVSLESIRWAINGVLVAMKDTIFVFLSGLISIVVFFSLPSLFVVHYLSKNVSYTFFIWILYSITSCLISLHRFYGLNHRKSVTKI